MAGSNRVLKLPHLQLSNRARKHLAPARLVVRGKLGARTDMLFGVLGIAVLILLWCAVTYGGLVPANFLPTPTAIWRGLAEFHERQWLIPAILRSTRRVVTALILVISIGVPIGILIGAFAPVDAFLRKIVNGGKAVPTTALGGLVVLWAGIDDSAKIVFLFLGAIFYMIILVKNAILNVNEEYLRVALDLGANRWQMIWRVLLPGAVPQIWDAIAVCSGIMWTYIILAEFINSSPGNLGVGYLLFTMSRLGGNGAGKVFGMIIVIALISSLTDFLLQFVRKKLFNW